MLRADNLHPTDMSKLLYVELLTPDGYLVERQRVIIDHETQSLGSFACPIHSIRGTMNSEPTLVGS